MPHEICIGWQPKVPYLWQRVRQRTRRGWFGDPALDQESDFDGKVTPVRDKTERTPLLGDVPSQILRNGAVKFRQAYQRFFKKLGGRPKFKKKSGRQAVWLSRELFEFIPQTDDQTGHIVSYQLSLGTNGS